MTSRPNSVPEHFFDKYQGKFDSIIENIGFDNDGIRQYVRKIFQNKNKQDFEISFI
jgi:hypothetical protein